MKYLKFIPWAIIALLIILNYAGCIGKRIKETVTVVEIDTVYQTTHDSFLVQIPVPVEKKIIVKVTENLDSLEQVYTDKINFLQRSIVEYKNAIFDLKHGTPPEEVVITANEYLDTIDTDTYSLKVAIGVVGHLESFDYSLEQFEKKETCPDCPKIRDNYVFLGAEFGFDGTQEVKAGYGHKWMYVKPGYKLREFNINNFTIETGIHLRF